MNYETTCPWGHNSLKLWGHSYSERQLSLSLFSLRCHLSIFFDFLKEMQQTVSASHPLIHPRLVGVKDHNRKTTSTISATLLASSFSKKKKKLNVVKWRCWISTMCDQCQFSSRFDCSSSSKFIVKYQYKYQFLAFKLFLFWPFTFCFTF